MAGFVQKIKNMWNPPDDEYDEYYEDDDREEEEEYDTPVSGGRERETSRRTSSSFTPSSSSSGNKVVNIHATAQLQVVLFKPEHFGEETRNVADELLKMNTVVLNL